jgi:hypothetical protein
VRRRLLPLAPALLLGAGCTTGPAPEARPTPTPSSSASVVLDPQGPLATAEPDSAGIVVLPSRAVLDDGPGDVWQLAPRRTRAKVPAIDVRRAVVTVARGEVGVRARFDDLRPVGRTTYDVGLRTPRGLFYLDVVSGPSTRSSRIEQFVDPSGEQGDCPGLRYEVADDLVTVAVPLGCVGDPPWVAARLLVSLQVGERSYAENPHNHRPFSEFFTERLYPPR